MSNYIEDPTSCRVDFFRTNGSGKWYETVAVKFRIYNGCIHAAFIDALKAEMGSRLKGMQAVCLEPYHQNSHPISLIWKG